MPSDLFDLTGRVAIVTGGAGLLGRQHCEAIAAFGGIPIIADIDYDSACFIAAEIRNKYHGKTIGYRCDATSLEDIDSMLSGLLVESALTVDILINNISCNANLDTLGQSTRLENYSYTAWMNDLELGLTSAFLCSKVIGGYMARRGSGIIVNIASDLSVIAPDQRLYRKEELADDEQPVKPISYSVVKHGIIGMTRYLATYWAGKVRVNALSPGGVYNNQSDDFVRHLNGLIPMGRMANVSEMQGALIFLCSDASAYVTGQNILIDGGRTAW